MSFFKEHNESTNDESAAESSDEMFTINASEVESANETVTEEVKEEVNDGALEATEETVVLEPVPSEVKEETESPLANMKVDTESVTVITKGTTITGSIVSDCSLEVMGTINGDISCLGKLTILGKVRGNTNANEVFINTNRFEGDISAEGPVKVAQKTVVVGNISAHSGVFAGAVKGELDIKGPVVLDSTAVIKGNIKAKSLQVNNGAVIDGFCSLTYSDTKIDTMFE